MTAQTSYDRLQPAAYPGLLYGVGPKDIISRAVEGVAGIEFGVACSRGTDVEKQVLPGGTAFLGISVRSLDREGAANTGAIKYNETEAAALLREGYIWAVCPAGCNAGDPVKYTNATGVLDAGAAAAGETQLDEAQWDTTVAAGELGVIVLGGTSTTAGS